MRVVIVVVVMVVIVMGVAVVMSGASFAESTVGVIMVMICKVRFSVF